MTNISMSIKEKINTLYQNKVDKELFEEYSNDLLFKDNTKPFLKDRKRFLRAKDLLDDPQNKLIYEIGIYPGTSLYFFGTNNQIIGFGKSKEIFGERIQNLGHVVVEVDLENCDLGQYEKKADIVLCMEVLEHIRNPHQFLKKIIELLSLNGHLYLTTNNHFYIGYLSKLLQRKNILDPIETESTFYPGHCRYYSLKELKDFFDNQNCEIISSKNINFLPSSKYYKNTFFGLLKNWLVKLSPISYSTHVEFLIKRKE